MDQIELARTKRYNKYFPMFLQAIIYTFTIIIFKIFCRFKVEGLENLKLIPQKAIFASNHNSEWDGILIRVALPFFSRFSPMYYVALKKDGYVLSKWRQLFYGGKLFELLGAYPVYLGQKDYAVALRHHINILNLGNSLCIFPEGKKSRDGNIGEAKGGVAYLAYRTNSLIVPIAISGLYRLNLKDFLLRKRYVKISMGNPIYPKDLFNNLNISDEKLDNHNMFKEVSKKIMVEISRLGKI